MYIFHKTEIQTVILRCLSLNINQYKFYETKHKNAKNAKCFFLYKIAKRNGNEYVCILCLNFWTNQNLDLLGTSKWQSESQFWDTYWQKMAKNGREMVLYEWHLFWNSLYYIVVFRLLTVSKGYIMYLYSQWSSAIKPFRRKGAAMRGKNLPRPKESLESPAVTYKKIWQKIFTLYNEPKILKPSQNKKGSKSSNCTVF